MAENSDLQHHIDLLTKQMKAAMNANAYNYWGGFVDTPTEAPSVPDDKTGAAAADDRIIFNIVFKKSEESGPKSVAAHYYECDTTENTYDFYETKGEEERIVLTVAKGAVLYIEASRG